MASDMRLFEITGAVRNKSSDHREYYRNRDLLNPPQRLVHGLCLKTDGNVLWITAILSSTCVRLADGQSVTELITFVIDLPADVEDYYYDLVYTRIHSTYRTGKASECAMALKIVSCVID